MKSLLIIDRIMPVGRYMRPNWLIHIKVFLVYVLYQIHVECLHQFGVGRTAVYLS